MRGADSMRAGERDARLLAAGQRVGIARADAGETDAFERGVGERRPRGLALDRRRNGEGQVAADRHMRKQQRVLEQDAGVAILRGQRGQIDAVDGDAALGREGRIEKAADDRRAASTFPSRTAP